MLAGWQTAWKISPNSEFQRRCVRFVLPLFSLLTLKKYELFWDIDFIFQEKDKLVGEVIRYMLFKTHQNSGCPIKRDELTHLITKNYHQRNFPTFVINEAKDKLSTVFGYEMRELQRSLPSSKTQARLSQPSENSCSVTLICRLYFINGSLLGHYKSYDINYVLLNIFL